MYIDIYCFLSKVAAKFLWTAFADSATNAAFAAVWMQESALRSVCTTFLPKSMHNFLVVKTSSVRSATSFRLARSWSLPTRRSSLSLSLILAIFDNASSLVLSASSKRWAITPFGMSLTSTPASWYSPVFNKRSVIFLSRTWRFFFSA